MIFSLTKSFHTSIESDRPGERRPEKECWWWLMFQHPERTSSLEPSLDKKYVTPGFKPFSIKNLSVMALQALLKVFFLWKLELFQILLQFVPVFY